MTVWRSSPSAHSRGNSVSRIIGTGGGEPVGGRFEHGPAFRLRLVPMRAAAQRRAAAAVSGIAGGS